MDQIRRHAGTDNGGVRCRIRRTQRIADAGQIRKRGSSWCVVLYLGRRPQDGKKVYKWTTYPTRREAEAALPKLLTQIGAGATLPSARLNVAVFLEQWLRDYVEGLPSLVTRRNYRDIVRVHLLPALGHMPLVRLSPQTIQMYVSQKLAQGQSATSVQCHFAVLREALGHAVRWGLLARNPTDSVDPPRRRHRGMQVWDEEQVRLFLPQARRSSQHYCLYLTAILTGMRQGELPGLRWRNIDFALGTASIQQTMYRLGSTILLKEPKTARGRRSVALPAPLIAALSEHREHQLELRGVLGTEYEDHDLVFCQPNGKPLHAHNIVQRDFRRVIEKAKLPRIRFHDLRHTHATHLLRAGVHPKVVQERLGHSTPAFTLAVYSHVLPGMQEQAARVLSSRLLGRPETETEQAGGTVPSSETSDDSNADVEDSEDSAAGAGPNTLALDPWKEQGFPPARARGLFAPGTSDADGEDLGAERHSAVPGDKRRATRTANPENSKRIADDRENA